MQINKLKRGTKPLFKVKEYDKKSEVIQNIQYAKLLTHDYGKIILLHHIQVS